MVYSVEKDPGAISLADSQRCTSLAHWLLQTAGATG